MSDFDLNSYKIIKENPRYVTISGDIQNIGYEDNISICANGNLLRRGDKVLLHGNENIIKHIEEVANRKTSFHIYFHNLNKGSYFLTPFYAKDKLSIAWDKYFCNTFIKYKNKDGIYFMFKYVISDDMNAEDVEYLKFEKKLCKHPNFINTYEIDGYTIFEFSIVEEFKDSIALILSGKYSKLEDKVKELIVQFHNANEKNILYGVLYKTDYRKREVEELFGITLDNDDEYLGEFLEEEPKDISNKIKTRMWMYNELI